MRICKSQCSLFKELHSNFVNNKVDEETKHWMEQHKKECSYCKEWCKSVEEDREDIIFKNSSKMFSDDIQPKKADKVKVFVTIGMGFMLFLAVWLSS